MPWGKWQGWVGGRDIAHRGGSTRKDSKAGERVKGSQGTVEPVWCHACGKLRERVEGGSQRAM